MASDLNELTHVLCLSLDNIATAHHLIAESLEKQANSLICIPTMDSIWQDVFLVSFRLFRDMDPTLPASEVRDLAIADANCVVETLRQKNDDIANDGEELRQAVNAHFKYYSDTSIKE